MSKITIKFATVGIAIATVASLSGPVFAQSADLNAQIAALMAQIAALQSQVGAQSSSTSSYNFAKNLTLGSTGADVKALQGVLIAGGYLKIAAPTTTFGPLTKAAVIAWQKAVGISPTSGMVGPLSRAKLNAMGGTTSGTTGGTTGGTTVVVPSGTGLVVSKASDSPSDRTIGSGTAFNPALKVALSAGASAVKVTGLTVFKSGFLANSSLNGVDVVDSKGVRHGNVITSVGADNTINLIFSSDPVVIAAGSSETLTVRFNLVSGAMTGTVVMSLQSVASVSTDAKSVSGAFPITGSIENVVAGSNALATVTLDVLTSTGSSTLNVDPASQQEITKFRIQETSSNEAVKLYSWTLYNYGNAGATDYSDVKLVAQNGDVLATAQAVGQNIKFDLSANPYFIDKGQTKDFTVTAKLINGTTKTVQLVTYNDYDLDIRGVATSVSLMPGAGSTDTSFPIGNGFNIQTIGSGSLTLSRSTDTPSAAVTPGTNDTVLAKYVVKPTGENYELRQVSFYISRVTTALTGTVYVKVNDQTVYSVAASGVSSSSPSTVTLSSYPILTSGVNNTITVSASVNSTAVSTDVYTVKSFDLIQAKRLVTNDLVDPGTSAIDGLGIAVQAAKLTVTNLSTPSSQSVVKGTSAFEFAQVQLSAQGGGEDIKVSKVVITDTSALSTDLTNVVIYKDGETSPLVTSASTANFSAATNGTVSFNLQSPILVTRTTPVVLHVKADVGTSASTTPTHVLSVKTDVTAYGSATGNTVSGSSLVTAGTSQTMAIASSGTLTLSLVSGSGATPAQNQVVTAGTSGATYLAFKLTSQIEAQKITSLKVTASTGTLSTTTLRNIALYQDNSSVSFASAGQWDSCASNTCTVTFTATDNLLAAPVPTTGSNIYVKADVPAGGQGVTLGDSFKLSIAAAADIVTKGAVSAATTTATGTAVPTAMSYVAPQSVVVDAVSPTSATQVGLSAGQVVGIFKITNNGSAPIYLASTTSQFTVSNGGAATTTVKFELYASAQGGSQSDTSITYATSTTSGGATGASSSIPFDLSAAGVSEANRQINGGSFRYVTIKTNGVAANNDTFALSISALGNVKYYVNESDLGYSGNPFTNSNISDSLTGMYTSGVPSLGTVTAKT
ncbi:MAG: peptidoglycan-binding protein [Candidatus Jorgensenbacteria bacterium]|nr:peptidoglycan-binding protein [Candidatus Jorgensenbacteria bacterium]